MWETITGVMGTAMLGIIAWAFQLNSRLAVVETKQEGFEQHILSKFDEISRRLERIETKIDGNGKH